MQNAELKPHPGPPLGEGEELRIKNAECKIKGKGMREEGN